MRIDWRRSARDDYTHIRDREEAAHTIWLLGRHVAVDDV